MNENDIKYVLSAHAHTQTWKVHIGMQVKVFTSILMFMKMRQQQKKLPLNWYFNKILLKTKGQFQRELSDGFSLNILSVSRPSLTWKRILEREMWDTVAFMRDLCVCAKSTHYQQKWKKLFTFTLTHTDTDTDTMLQSEMFACTKLFSNFKSKRTINVKPCRRLDVVSLCWYQLSEKIFFLKREKNESCQMKKLIN